MRFLILIMSIFLVQNAFSQKRFVSIDSTQIWINTIGLENRQEGQPLIIFENGHGVPMDNWDKVIQGASAHAPILTYDRPGVGKSDAVDEIPNIKNVSDRLVKILDELELAPPYILVGHSLGGLYVRGFAIHYPEMLAGLIIVDPADFTENHTNKRAYYADLNWQDEKVDSLINTFIAKRNQSHAKASNSIRLEGQYLEEIRDREFAEITENVLPNIPVHILMGGRFDMPKKYRSTAYDAEAVFRTKMSQRASRWIAVIQSVEKGMFFYSGDSGHYVQWDDPDLVIASIKLVIEDYERLQEKD